MRLRELLLEEVLVQLEQMDPTKKKLYVQWLVNQYSNNKFRLEDGQKQNLLLKQMIILGRDTAKHFPKQNLINLNLGMKN